MKRLVSYNENYYIYPVSVSRGYESQYPTPLSLTDAQLTARRAWQKQAEKRRNSKWGQFVFGNLFSTDNVSILRSQAADHGVFAYRFFREEVRNELIKRLSRSGVNKAWLSQLHQTATGYNRTLSDVSDVVQASASHIYECLVLGIEGDKGLQSAISNWFTSASAATTCDLCGRRFRIIDLPDWLYFGASGFERCCFTCEVVETPRKRQIADRLPRLIEICGFVPPADAGPISRSFTSRLSRDNWMEAQLCLASLGGTDHVKKKFGSWFKAMAQSHALPEGSLVTARGVRCLANDGHECHSLDEKRIDDWLTMQGIRHEREPLYPFHSELNADNKLRADWLIDETFVEYFGMLGDTAYEERVARKLTLVSEMDMDLIEIYPRDLINLDRVLLSKLSP